MHRSGHKNLQLLWWLRSIAVIGQATAIAVVMLHLRIHLPVMPLGLIIGGLVVVNGFSWWRLRTPTPVSDAEFFGQLLIDMAALWGLLYFTGGAANPFSSLFILQVIIAATTLTPRYTWAVAALAIAFYTALMLWKIEVPDFEHHSMGDFFNLHVQGMWISFILLALIVAWFVVRMKTTIRKQDAILADAEKMAAVGALAANAAHELGTPLATLLVLAEEAGAHAPLVKAQLARCKEILSRITAAGAVMRAEGGAPVHLDAFLNALLARWKDDHPSTALRVQLPDSDAPLVMGDYGLEQALRNLLDNAADASPDAVEIEAGWTAHTISIAIRDYGTGVSHDMQPALGEIGVTTKEDGLGLGLFLTRSVIHRQGGTLEFQPATGRGTLVTVRLPLSRIAV